MPVTTTPHPPFGHLLPASGEKDFGETREITSALKKTAQAFCLRSLTKENRDDYLLKLAWTDVPFAIETMQVGAVPEHAPPQLANVLPSGGIAVRVADVPCVNFVCSARQGGVGVRNRNLEEELRAGA